MSPRSDLRQELAASNVVKGVIKSPQHKGDGQRPSGEKRKTIALSSGENVTAFCCILRGSMEATGRGRDDTV